MKAVILAAGRGTRIHSVTAGHPKCLLTMGNRSMLDLQIENLFRVGVTEIVIVVGHEHQEIVSDVTERHGERIDRIEFIVNPKFASTNNMYSLWLARHWIEGSSFLCLNADVLCHPDILWMARGASQDISVMVDPEFREETTKVIIQDGWVTELSKAISRQDYSGTFANVLTFSTLGADVVFRRAEKMFASGKVNQFVNDVISELAGEGTLVGSSETEGLPWAEVDDPNDLQFARDHVYPELKAFFDPAPVLIH